MKRNDRNTRSVLTALVLIAVCGIWTDQAGAVVDCSGTITIGGSSIYQATDDYTTNSLQPCLVIDGPGMNLQGHSVTCTAVECGTAIVTNDHGSSGNNTVTVKNGIISGSFEKGIDSSLNTHQTRPIITANTFESVLVAIYGFGEISNNVIKVDGDGCFPAIFWVPTDEYTAANQFVSNNFIDCNGSADGQSWFPAGIQVFNTNTGNGTPKVHHNFIRVTNTAIVNSGAPYYGNVAFNNNILVSALDGTLAAAYLGNPDATFSGNVCDQDLEQTSSGSSFCPVAAPFTLP